MTSSFCGLDNKLCSIFFFFIFFVLVSLLVIFFSIRPFVRSWLVSALCICFLVCIFRLHSLSWLLDVSLKDSQNNKQNNIDIDTQNLYILTSLVKLLRFARSLFFLSLVELVNHDFCNQTLCHNSTLYLVVYIYFSSLTFFNFMNKYTHI